jgi:hypothetical protein
VEQSSWDHRARRLTIPARRRIIASDSADRARLAELILSGDVSVLK